MTRVSVSKRSRVASTALAAALMLFLVGDRAAYTAIEGIDPLDVLDLAIKNNVLFIVDTSGSMTGTTIKVPNAAGSRATMDVGGDDPASRFYQAKRALREVVKESEGIANFGLATFHASHEDREMRASANTTPPSPVGLWQPSTSEGPLLYVSQNAEAAAWLTYFDGVYSSTLTNYDGWTSPEVFSSLGYTSLPGYTSDTHGWDRAYPSASCINNPNAGLLAPANEHTFGTHCRYYLRSMLLRNNLRFTWDPNLPRNPGPMTKRNNGLLAVSTITCPTPPKGLLGDDVNPFNDGTGKRACFEIQRGVNGPVATYFLSSTSFTFEDKDGVGGTNECQQTDINLDVVPCTDTAISQNIQDLMRLELQPDTNTGLPIDVPFTQYPGIPTTKLDRWNPHDNLSTVPSSFYTNPRRTGIRSAGGTPIAASLRWAKGYFENYVFNPAFRPAAVVGKQKNFVILLTDGYESCTPGGTAAEDAATTDAARALYALTPSPDNRVETLVIGLVAGGSRSNMIARAGSGNMRDAYSATDLPSLIEALKDAISLAAFTGTYSAQSSMTASIYELGSVLSPPVDPLDPSTRYTANVPVLVRSTFEMPGFKGHLKAFRASGTSVEVWDAGQKLLDRVQNGMAACTSRTVDSGTYNACTFAELHNGATEVNVGSVAKIKRRIYTTSRNNFDAVTAATLIARTANQGARVALWPPDTSTNGVAPADNGNSAGKLDDALGLKSITDPLVLQSRFRACLGGNLPADCTSTNAQVKLQQHWREAREMMLAFLAGAQTIPDDDGNPERTGGSGPTAKKLLYKARPWILAESTLSAPAVVTPPLESKPIIHVDEYKLYRDGPRNGSTATDGTLQGFGLRNPDDDGVLASKNDMRLKPAMTVVYHGANDGLHAFRGAPCPASPPSPSGLPCAGETGGEELWSFVPFDQLGKLAGLMKTQRRSDKTYMIAAPVRFADVWVPGAFTTPISGASAGQGVWRTMLYVGRGIGGKYITALDVTVPGPFTRHSLNDPYAYAYAPIPVWSRGNPDTSDGKPFGSGNVYNNPHASAGPLDYAAYSHMGQTWSVPAIGSVTAAQNTTPRTPGGVEYVAYVGSGYSGGVTGEGTTFYALDALTGDVIASTDVGPATAPSDAIFTPNALVASPAVFTPSQLKAGFIGNSGGQLATRVYIGDVYGRLWKFLPSTANTGFPAILMKDFGVRQPIGNGVALLNVDTDGTGEKPHIYLETGRDIRVSPPPAATPPFKMIGLRDNGTDTNPTADPDELFPQSDPGVPGIDFPGAPDPVRWRFRGTVQPATTFNANGGTDYTQRRGRVFFVGTQFNPIDANCISSFDSILFALTAGTGTAAYDMGNASAPLPYATFIDQKMTGVQVVEGQLVLDEAIGAGTPPPPPAPPTTLPASSESEGEVTLGSTLPASTLYRVGSVVCQP